MLRKAYLLGFINYFLIIDYNEAPFGFINGKILELL